MSGAGAENGAEQARKSSEQERSGSEAGGHVDGSEAVSGDRRRCERWAEISTAPAPLICSGFDCEIVVTSDMEDDGSSNSVYMIY